MISCGVKFHFEVIKVYREQCFHRAALPSLPRFFPLLLRLPPRSGAGLLALDQIRILSHARGMAPGITVCL